MMLSSGAEALANIYDGYVYRLFVFSGYSRWLLFSPTILCPSMDSWNIYLWNKITLM